MKDKFSINWLISELTDQEGNNTTPKSQLILMKNFIEKRTIECIGSFMQEGIFDSIEDIIVSLKKIKSVLLSITTYEELFESVENEEFGQIGITCLSDFFEDYSEFLDNIE